MFSLNTSKLVDKRARIMATGVVYLIDKAEKTQDDPVSKQLAAVDKVRNELQINEGVQRNICSELAILMCGVEALADDIVAQHASPLFADAGITPLTIDEARQAVIASLLHLVCSWDTVVEAYQTPKIQATFREALEGDVLNKTQS